MSKAHRVGCLDAMVSTIRNIQRLPDDALRQSLTESAREVVDAYFERGEITSAARSMLQDMLDEARPS